MMSCLQRSLAIGLFISSSVNLSQAEPQLPPLESLNVTASRFATAGAKQNTSLTQISAEELEQLSHLHANELLNRVPGVWVSRGNGQEHLTAIRSPVLTGPGSCGAFLITEEGIPVRPTGFCNVNELFDLNTEQAARIEVLRGPGTELHSSDALHGVINVITQAPIEGGEHRLSLEGGSNDYGRVKLSSSDKSQEHGYSIHFNGAADGGYKDDSGFDQQKLSARYDYYGEQLKVVNLLSASNLNQETAGFVSGEEAYKDGTRKRENGDPAAYRDSQSLRWQSRFELDRGKQGQFILTPYARYSEMDFLMHFLPGTPVEENGQHSIGLQMAYSRAIDDQLTLTQGVDMEWTEGYLKQTQAGGFGPFPAGKQYDYEVEAQLYAAFISADYQLREGTNLNLGTRFEHLRYAYDNRMLSGNSNEDGLACPGGCRYSRPDDRTDTFDNYSVSAGLVQQFGSDHQLTLRLSHGFRAPQVTEMYRLQAGQVIPDLDSEELNSIELGLRGGQDKLHYELVAFYMKKTNVIIQDSDRRRIDDGQTEHMGLETALQWQFAEHWDFALNATLARHEYSSDVSLFGSNDSLSIEGNDVDTAPHVMGAARLGWQQNSTRIELEWVATGKYYTDIDNLHSYEGHDLLHLRLRQQIGKRLSVGLRINNLSDEDYAERADFSGFSGDRYFIGEPRRYYADISWRF